MKTYMLFSFIEYSALQIFHTSYFALSRWVNYSNQHACMPVCISQKPHAQIWPNFLYDTCGSLLWWQWSMLCYILQCCGWRHFLHDGANGPESYDVFFSSLQSGGTGAKSAVCDCIVSLAFFNICVQFVIDGYTLYHFYSDMVNLVAKYCSVGNIDSMFMPVIKVYSIVQNTNTDFTLVLTVIFSSFFGPLTDSMCFYFVISEYYCILCVLCWCFCI